MAAFLEDTANAHSTRPSAAATPLAGLVPKLAPVRGNGSRVAPRPTAPVSPFPRLRCARPSPCSQAAATPLGKKTAETNLAGACIRPQLCPDDLPPSPQNSYGVASAHSPHPSRQAASSPRPPRWSRLAGTGRDPIVDNSQCCLLSHLQGSTDSPHPDLASPPLLMAPTRSLRWGLLCLAVPGLTVP